MDRFGRETLEEFAARLAGDGERFSIAKAKADYVEGRIDCNEMERRIEAALHSIRRAC
ncbi:MAG TPA: hypothetical protein VGF95_14565 [Solirubrobacteraceae bacterium]|jgi:hypothetical protein